MNHIKPHIEHEEISVHRFIWTDGVYKLSAGELLGVILELLHTSKPHVYIQDTTLADYLVSLGFITMLDIHQYTKTETASSGLEQLGRRISRYIDTTIEQLPPGTTMALAPALFIRPE